MIDGITVLYQDFPHIDILSLLFGALAAVGSIAIIIICIIAIFKDDLQGFWVLAAVISLVLALGIWGMFSSKTEYREKILVDDTVPYSYIEEHYDILDTEGKILTVRPITED